MGRKAEYLQILAGLAEWEPYLLRESGLPGPRGNIELAQAAADLGQPVFFERCLAWTPERAPVNDPGEFLAFCGVIGLGRLAAEGSAAALARLRGWASDPRWRLREGVAMALQRVGAVDMPRLLDEMEAWASGGWLEKRAAAAALAEPALLHDPAQVRRVLALFERITAAILPDTNRRSEAFIAFRKGMAYCWSVAAAALPAEGLPLIERWCASTDADIRWIMRENLKKNRLLRADADGVQRALARLD